MSIKSKPEWLGPPKADEHEIAGTFDMPGGDHFDAWVGYYRGDAEITLDGNLTAPALRDLAAMIEANRPDPREADAVAIPEPQRAIDEDGRNP